MKKNFLFFLMLLFACNVKAMSIYSDYNFIGYSPSPLENSEYYKYETVHMHRYYSIGKVNEVYASLDSNIESSPYVDLNDSIKGKYYLGDKSEFGVPRPVIFMKLDESYYTNTINITNLNTYGDKIHEIKVYNLNRQIEYTTLHEYEFLKDGDIANGQSVSNGNFTLTLDNYYDLKDIKILVHYDAFNYYSGHFTIEYVNENGTNKKATIMWDYNNGNPCIQWLEFKVGDEYVKFLVDNNILPLEYASTNILRVTYEYEYPLYKHYNLGKIYYKNSFLEELDGYKYDGSEDIIFYKVYAREYLGEEDSKQEEKSEKQMKPFVYRALPVNEKKVEDAKEKLTSTTTTRVLSYTKQNTRKEESNNRDNQKDIFLIFIIIAIVISCFMITYRFIKILYDKFTGKS